MRASLPTPLLLVLLLQTGSAFAIENDFSSYPEGAQSCLYDSADDAGCSSGATGAELNNCLCKNKNNFIYNTAGCVAKESPSDLNAVYETLSNNCEGTGVTLSVSKQAFLAAATAATQTTSIPSPTASSTTTTPSTTGSPGQQETDDGLSTGTKIGIGVGVGFGAIAAGLAAWFIWAYQRRRRSAHSIHSNEVSGGGAGSSYGGPGSFAMTNEYAQDNMQHTAAELAPVAWKQSAAYGMQGYTGSEDKNGRAAGVPLLAELGAESGSRTNPVELPATPGYLGYSDRVPAHANGRATPDGVSPATYNSQSGRGDLSPLAPSHSSDGGTYR
ncbi:hypothetical protein F5B22DRAFT_641386 [Xylaria bambusicola]|uniref:uncharacterized protein n=1 Tax=Xylaria bambusicola TaxID=326684 RepID=UPI002007E3F4|nr:uncharacterized protein F5B22DRAFT_641386 [Xylaria bambusicola]KAI0526234.1 hypothetical protein F5B22DRAFT_641386 [Xylaria bambusicola]